MLTVGMTLVKLGIFWNFLTGIGVNHWLGKGKGVGQMVVSRHLKMFAESGNL